MIKNKITTIEQYSKKYRNRRYRLLKISKNDIKDFNKGHNLENDFLLKGRKWILIGDTYYEIPKAPSFTWFRNIHVGFKVGLYALLTGAAVTSVVLATMKDAKQPIEYITYTLDSDIKLKKNPEYDIEIVNNPKLPGKTIAHKNKNSTEFKIQAFTDLHLDHKRECCNYTFSMLARNIMDYKPDLIVFCGDTITSSYNEPRTHQFAKMLEELGVYWCAVLGNHEKSKDNPYCIEREHMVNIWRQYPHCLIDKTSKQKLNDGTEVWGVGNSLVNLAIGDEVVQSLFFLDSGTEMTDEQKVEYAKEIDTYLNTFHRGSSTTTDFYDHIKDSQVDWYRQTFEKVKKISPDTHSTIFTHVPIIEQEDIYLKLFNEWEESSFPSQEDQKSQRAKKEHMRAFTDFPQTAEEWPTNPAKNINELYTLSSDQNCFVKGKYNRRREGVCYSPHDIRTEQEGKSTPILQAMTEFGDNNALFAGHDHENNYTFKTKGQFLGYIQFGAYSTSNLYKDGLLGKDPYKPDEKTDPYSGHLNEGYTEIIYKEESNSQKNIIDSIDTKENYYIWEKNKPELDLYKRALDVIKKQMLAEKKPKVYADDHESFLDGKN